MTKRTGDKNKMVEWDFHFYCKQFAQNQKDKKCWLSYSIFTWIQLIKLKTVFGGMKNKKGNRFNLPDFSWYSIRYVADEYVRIILELFVCVKTRTSLHFANCVLVRIWHTFSVNMTTTDSSSMLTKSRIIKMIELQKFYAKCLIFLNDASRINLRGFHIFNRLMVDGLR